MADHIEPEDTIDTRAEEQPAVKETSPTKPVEEPAEIKTTPAVSANSDDPAVVIQSAGRHRWRHWLGHHKKVVIPVAVFVVVLGILAGVPATRYAIAGLVVKRQFTVTVVDSQTGKPVSSAAVTLRGQTINTNNQGRATIKVPVGKTTLSIEKKYYKAVSQQVLIPLKKPVPLALKFEATGRQVPVSVINKITGKPLANATLVAAKTQIITDKNGEATLVLPANNSEVDGILTATNYNKLAVKVKITTTKDPANTFAVTPAGKIYFLSNASGTLDVVKTDLDGQNRVTVLKGTDKEDKPATVLLASQNWKYLALLSKRDGGANPKLYLIDTSNDALSTMDEGDADFNPVGWSGTTFVYQVNRHDKKSWDAKAQAIKSFDAVTKKLSTLDETSAAGTGYSDYFGESYVGTYIFDNEIVFAKSIYAASPAVAASHSAGLYSVRPDGSNKKTVKAWLPAAANSYVSVALRPYEPSAIYVANTSSDDEPLYEYEGGQLKSVDGKKGVDIWNLSYNTYLFSPSNKLTFWNESRDGKSAFFLGDDDGKNQKQVGVFSEGTAFGWYTDDYVVMSKGSSELYIAPAGEWGAQKPLKVTDYFKPSFSAPGYGKGYGGW